jgi:pimeloyl-ACP methyl ester carboxylesterase
MRRLDPPVRRIPPRLNPATLTAGRSLVPCPLLSTAPPPGAWLARALSIEAQTGTLDAGGCPIAYRRWGDPASPGLVLVHGGGAHSHWWDHIAPFFAGDSCAMAIDLSGHGDSGRRPGYGFADWSGEIAAAAAALRQSSGRPPVVIAHSLGGLATFHAAALYGSEFEGIITIDSPIAEESAEQRARRRQEAFGPLRVYPDREAALARFRTVPDQPFTDPEIVAHIARHSMRPVEGGWSWKFDPAVFTELVDPTAATLAAITCRVGVLRAEHGLVTPDIGHRIYEMLGRTAPVIEIPLAYHHVMLDQPLLLVAALRALLADWRHSYSLRAGPSKGP